MFASVNVLVIGSSSEAGILW